MNSSFAAAVVLLFLVCDPLGNIPIFTSALRTVTPARRRRIILRECLVAFVVLMFFALIGRPFLNLLGLSETSLQIGGAVVLLLVAVRMVFPSADGVYGQMPAGEPFIVPLAVPALAGPSALASVLLLVSRDPARTFEWIAAIAVVMATAAVVLTFAERLQQILGESVTAAFERLMGLILAAVSVELMLRGIKTFVGTL
jgi:MarC family membrane protein